MRSLSFRRRVTINRESIIMKITHLVSGIALLALGTGPALADPEVDSDHCNLETLHGTLAYAFVESPPGQFQGGLVGIPTSSSGEEYYDGKGHMKYYQFVSDGTNSYTNSGTGTYTITKNCIATVTYEYDGAQSGIPWVYFVVPDGSGYYWNSNQGAGVLSAGRVTRISHADLIP
jgi:hypothetical protein